MKEYTKEFHVEDFLRKEFEESSKNFSEILEASPSVNHREGTSVLFFSINGSTLGIPTHSVITVEREMIIEKIPFIKNSHCLGFISLWGQAIPVLNIRSVLGLSVATKNKNVHERVIFFSAGGLTTSMIVDSVEGVSTTTIGEFDTFAHLRVSTAKGYYKGKLSSILLASELSSLLEERVV